MNNLYEFTVKKISLFFICMFITQITQNFETSSFISSIVKTKIVSAELSSTFDAVGKQTLFTNKIEKGNWYSSVTRSPTIDLLGHKKMKTYAVFVLSSEHYPDYRKNSIKMLRL